MSELDELFTENPIEHPMLGWMHRLQRRESNARFSVTIVREREGLLFLPTEIELRAEFPEGQTESKPEPWDYDLNLSLVQEHVRAHDPENEIERFGLMLRHLFLAVEGRYGNGFFNTILVNYIARSGLSRYQSVDDVLRDIVRDQPKSSSASEDCRNRIRSVLSQCAGWLVQCLGYDQQSAEDILAGAVAYYLDERFSVTNRRLLGWSNRLEKEPLGAA